MNRARILLYGFPIETYSIDRRFRGAHITTSCQLKQEISQKSTVRWVSQSLEGLEEVD